MTTYSERARFARLYTRTVKAQKIILYYGFTLLEDPDAIRLWQRTLCETRMDEPLPPAFLPHCSSVRLTEVSHDQLRFFQANS